MRDRLCAIMLEDLCDNVATLISTSMFSHTLTRNHVEKKCQQMTVKTFKVVQCVQMYHAFNDKWDSFRDVRQVKMTVVHRLCDFSHQGQHGHLKA